MLPELITPVRPARSRRSGPSALDATQGTKRRRPDRKKLRRAERGPDAPDYHTRCGTGTLLIARMSGGEPKHTAGRLRCKGWRCATECARCLAATWRARVSRVPNLTLMLTLTLHQKASASEADLAAAERRLHPMFGNLTKRWRRAFGAFEFFVLVEWHLSGWPHLHVLVRDGPSIRDERLCEMFVALLREQLAAGPSPDELTYRLLDKLEGGDVSVAGACAEVVGRDERKRPCGKLAYVSAAGGERGLCELHASAMLVKLWLDVHAVEAGFGPVSRTTAVYGTPGAAAYLFEDVGKAHQHRADYSRGLRRVRCSRGFFAGAEEEKTERSPVLGHAIVAQPVEDVAAAIRAEGGAVTAERSRPNRHGTGPTDSSLEVVSYEPHPGGRFDLSKPRPAAPKIDKEAQATVRKLERMARSAKNGIASGLRTLAALVRAHAEAAAAKVPSPSAAVEPTVSTGPNVDARDGLPAFTAFTGSEVAETARDNVDTDLVGREVLGELRRRALTDLDPRPWTNAAQPLLRELADPRPASSPWRVARREAIGEMAHRARWRAVTGLDDDEDPWALFAA